MIPTRRDQMLYQMGIQEWRLTRPECLKGVVNLPIDKKIKLIVISTMPLEQNHPLLKDIFQSLELSAENHLSVTKDLAVNLNLDHSVAFLCLGLEDDFQQQLKKQFPQSKVWQSQRLERLNHGKNKRQLWQQMQH